MKITPVLIFLFFVVSCKTESLQVVIDRTTEVVLNGQKPTDYEIGMGLKQALSFSIEKGAATLSQRNGFFANKAIKILLPSEIQEIQFILKRVGFGKISDELTVRLNRAAEDAAIKSVPIFKDAILSMTFRDVMTVLMGPEDAATKYLEQSTTENILRAFKPKISESLKKVGAVKLWKETFERYNKIPLVKKVDTDLVHYTSKEALRGLFYSVSLREADIRKSPSFRSTPLLKKVFSYAETLK